MSAQLDLGWVYGVSPLVTFRMMTRLEHLTEKARQLDYKDFHVLELRERAGVFRMVCERQAGEMAPSRRLFGGKPMLKELQLWDKPSWDSSRGGELGLELTAGSATMTGRVGLAPAGTVGTRFTISLGIDAHGRKGEQELAEAIEAQLEQEHQFRLQWLERQVPYGI